MAISPPQWRRPYPVAAASRVVVQAGTLLGMLFAVAKLSPQTFGTFSVVWASTVILNSVVYTGLYEYLVRVVDVESAKHAVFWSFIGLGCAASLVLVGAGVLSGFGGGDALRHCYLMLAPLPILTGYHGWCDALLTRRGHAATAAVCFAVGEIGGVLALIAALSLGLELGALITWRIVTLMVSGVGIGLFVPDRPRLRASKASYAEAWRAALPLQGSGFVGAFSTYASDLFLAWHISPAACAAYRIASRASVAGADLFTMPMRPMTISAMAERERANDLAGLGKVYLDHLRVLTFFAWPTLLCVAVFSSRLFSVAAKPEWAEAGPLLMLLAMARIAVIPASFFSLVLVCTGRSAMLLRVQSIITLTSLAGTMLVSMWGAQALAWFELGRSIAVALFSTWMILRVTNLAPSELVRAVLPGCVAALACVGVGDLAFEMVSLGEPLRVAASVGGMGLCLLGCFALLRGRLAVVLPRSSATP